MSAVRLDLNSPEIYFDQTFNWNRKFWIRLGGMLDVAGKYCLDLGAGVCSLSAELASNCAHVVDLDPDRERIEIGKDIIRRRFPADFKRIKFFADTSSAFLGENLFDYVFSRDTFEHIGDLESVFGDIKRLLKPGGVLYAGFSPLYNSPFGDHKLLNLKLPWAHLAFNKIVRSRKNSVFLHIVKINHVHRELNFMNFADYEKLFFNEEFQVLSFEVNKSNSIIMRFFSIFRFLSKEMFSVNIYARLRKPLHEE